MRSTIVFTLTGSDRVGIVEEVTRVLLGLGGNVETSRMARLGGEFTMLVLLTLPAEKVGDLDAAMGHLTDDGYRITVTETREGAAEQFAGWPAYLVEVDGADHEGIVHDIAAGLAARGIQIESMETGLTRAPVSGVGLFSLSALVLVPPTLSDEEWIAALTEAGEHANVDVEVTRQ